MTLRQLTLASLLLCAAPLLAEGNDEFGTWQEIGIEKAITRTWDVGLDLEYRAQHKARFSAGLNTTYKPIKYLKLGIGYNFLYTGRPDKINDKSDYTAYPKEWTVGYNSFPAHWYPRHRFYAEATGTVKLWGWLRVSLRERYQFTHTKAYSIDRYRYRMKYENAEKTDFDENWEPYTYYELETELTHNEWDTKDILANTDQVLRSRVKLEYDKKRFPFSPYISAEAHNSVSVGDHMLLQKVRTAIGCGYKFRKHNEVSLSYVATFYMYDVEDGEVIRDHDRRHALSIGYKYSF